MSNNNLGKMPKTRTAWDDENYMDILKSAIIQSNSVSRTGDKPMAALSEKFDSHLSYRLVHELAAASIIKRLAEGLDLNGELAYAGMMMHDVGHPFSAHDGEEIFTSIGRLYNCGYFHHNAKGVETIRAENILNTALGMIPNIEYRPLLRRNLERDFNYVLDIVISHDGEADPRDLTKRPQEYPSIEKAVEDKLRRSNTKNDYKFVSQTPEGMLAKYADVIAYLSSDVRDGFRLGIIKTFNDKYLEIFGRIVATSPQDIKDTEEGKAVAIEIAKAKIKEIQEKYLEEYTEDVKNEKNAAILGTTREIINEINEKKINTYMLSKYFDEKEGDSRYTIQSEDDIEARTAEYEEEKEKIEDEVNEILQRHLTVYVEEQGEITPEKYESVKADIIKITQYVNEMIYINTRVVNEVTSTVQEFFIQDLIETTRAEMEEMAQRKEDNEHADGEICVPLLSKHAASLYTKAKNYGYTYYVPQTKTRYQKELLPTNVKKIVEYCAKGLLADNVIQRKLCDRTIRSKIPQELLRYADEDREAHDVGPKQDLKGFVSGITIKHRYTPAQQNRKSKFNIQEKLKRSVIKQGSRFANTYTYTCEALEHQIRNKIARVLSPDYKYAEKKDVLERQVEDELQSLRNSILAKYPDIAIVPQNEEDKLDKEQQKEQIIQDMLQQERKKIIEKMAIQLSIDYISGMTDEGIKDLAIELGYMTQQEYENAQNERGGEVTETLKNLQRMTAETPNSDGRED